MNNEVIDHVTKGKIVDITIKLIKLKNRLWVNDRTTYNQMKAQWNYFTQCRETTRYWIMFDQEVLTVRANGLLDDIKEITRQSLQLINSESVKEYLNSVREEAESLKTLIVIDKHELSIFN